MEMLEKPTQDVLADKLAKWLGSVSAQFNAPIVYFFTSNGEEIDDIDFWDTLSQKPVWRVSRHMTNYTGPGIATLTYHTEDYSEDYSEMVYRSCQPNSSYDERYHVALEMIEELIQQVTE